MNPNTRDALINFADAVSLLAQGCIHQIGVDSCTKIMIASEDLKDALKGDETIV